MNYKGAYSGDTNYAVGDVAVYTDGIPYRMHTDAPAGTPCHNALYWERVPQPLNDAVVMFHSMLTEMNAEISSATESGMIAPAYSKKTYNKGDIVTHSGKLYAAKADINPADNSWTAAHWEETTVGAQIAATNAAIPDNISNEAITLFDGDTECIITVDASGETPELEVTKATTEGDDT